MSHVNPSRKAAAPDASGGGAPAPGPAQVLREHFCHTFLLHLMPSCACKHLFALFPWLEMGAVAVSAAVAVAGTKSA